MSVKIFQLISNKSKVKLISQNIFHLWIFQLSWKWIHCFTHTLSYKNSEFQVWTSILVNYTFGIVQQSANELIYLPLVKRLFTILAKELPLLANDQVWNMYPQKWWKLSAWKEITFNMLFLPFFRMKISENNGFKEIYGLTPSAKVRRIKSSIGTFTPLLLWHISRKSLSLDNLEPLLWNSIIGWYESLLFTFKA